MIQRAILLWLVEPTTVTGGSDDESGELRRDGSLPHHAEPNALAVAERRCVLDRVPDGVTEVEVCPNVLLLGIRVDEAAMHSCRQLKRCRHCEHVGENCAVIPSEMPVGSRAILPRVTPIRSRAGDNDRSL